MISSAMQFFLLLKVTKNHGGDKVVSIYGIANISA